MPRTTVVHLRHLARVLAFGSVIASMLVGVTACDKRKATASLVREGEAAKPRPEPQLNLDTRPTILFQIFGDARDPRMIPIAAVEKDRLHEIVLDYAGWLRFDSLYFRKGDAYPLYRDGKPLGSVRVRKGMWEDPYGPVYSLKGCGTLTPLAVVRVDLESATEFNVDLFATNRDNERPHPTSAVSDAQARRVALQMAYESGSVVGLDHRAIDSLHLNVQVVETGTGRWPTIVAQLIDNRLDTLGPALTRASNLLLIGDADSAGTYRATYVHRVNAPLKTTTFRRYVDHLDILGVDGVDEIMLEGWKYADNTFLTVLRFEKGQWEEIFRTRENWCLERKQD
ncbi:MAG: hypothetical protein ABJD07_03235 [Gemmatimonadaceae bacterium]